MRKVLVIVAVVVVLAAVGLFVLRQNLDSLVASAIESHGSRLTGTEVTVGGVELHLRDGRAVITDLKVANPDGFSDRDALALGRLVLDLDPGSLTEEPYVIDELAVESVSVLYEVAGSGRRNLDVIRANLKEAQPAAEGGAGGGGDAPQPLLVIHDLRFADGTVQADAEAVGAGAREVGLSGFAMGGLGAPDGAPAAVIGKRVLQRLAERAADAALQSELAPRLREALGAEEGQDLDDAVKDKVGDLLGGDG